MTANPHPHSHSHSHPHSHPSEPSTKDPPLSAEHERIQLFLEAHFGALSRPAKVAPTTAEEDDADLYGATGEEEDEDEDLLTLIVELDGAKARVDLISMVRLFLLLRVRATRGGADNEQKVESESEDLGRRVEAVLEMAASTVKPLSLTFMGGGLGSMKGEEVLVA